MKTNFYNTAKGWFATINHQIASIVLLLCFVGISNAWGAEESVTFSAVYSNNDNPTTYNGSNFSVTFDKGTNSNSPVYKSTGNAIRIYGGGYFTVSSSNTITEIVVTFGSGDGSNAITTDVGTYSSGTWTGSATSVTFTVGGSSGHRRIAGLSVTYSSGGGGGGGSTTYDIVYDNSGQGSVDGDATAEEGDVVEITSTPNSSSYYLSSLTVYDDEWETISTTRVDESHYTFTMPASDVYVYAVFEALPSYSITYSVPTCVTSPSGTLTSQTYFASPSEQVPGYRFDGWVTASIPSSTSTKPSTIYKPGDIIPENNMTVYALYSVVSATFTRQTGSTPPVDDGNYMLCNAYSTTARVWANTVDGNRRCTTFEWDCSSTTTTCTDWSCIWIFKAGTGTYSGYWFIYNPEVDKYIGAYSTDNSSNSNYQVALLDDMNDATAWSCTVSSGRITLVNKLRTANGTASQQKIFCSGNYAGFGYSSNTSPYFFKNDAISASYTTNPTCPTEDHTITFNANGGTGSMSSITDIEDGTNQALTANNFEKEGYTFGGWTADVAVTINSSTVSIGSTIANQATLQNITSDINLTAIWTPTPYRVDVASVDHVTISVSSPSSIAEGNNANVNYGATVTLGQSGLESGYSVVWKVYKTGDETTTVSVSGSGNGATFTMPAFGVTVSATVTPPYVYFTECDDDACADKYCINNFKDGGNGMTCFTDQGDNVWTITNYAIPATGQTDRNSNKDFWVGYNGAYVDGKSANWVFRWVPFKNLSCSNYKLGVAPQAIGTLTINAATTGNDNNYELTFDPNGYGFCYGTDPSWETPIAFTRQGVTNVWNTSIVNVSDVISHSYYVGISKQGGGYVFSSDYDYNDDNEHIDGISTIATISGMGVVSDLTANPVTFRASTLSAADGTSGMRGYFQIWTDNCNRNFYCHFVPVYTITYKSYDGSSTLYTEEVAAGESFTVRAAESGSVGWAESASQSAASANYAVGAVKTPTGNVTLYVACTAYTVSYTATSGTIERDDVTVSSDVVLAGSSVTLPTVSDCSLTCAKFLGWYAGDYSNASKPSILAAGASYQPEDNVTLKAIYAIVGDNYELVTDAANLNVGSQVVIASSNKVDDGEGAYDVYVMGPIAGSGNNMTEVAAKVLAGGTTLNINSSEGVREFTLETGKFENTYSFVDASGYIYAAGGTSSNYLRNELDNDADGKGSFSISITDGAATMLAYAPTGTDARRNLLHNSSNSCFACYKTTQTLGSGSPTCYRPSIYQRSVSSYTTSPVCTTYSVSTCSPSNGTNSVSAATVSPGGNVTLTFTPNANYMLDAVTVTSGTATVGTPVYSSGETSGGTVSITNIQSDITVCASFKAIPLYTVTFYDVNNSTNSGVTQASYGADVTSPSSASAPCDGTWTFVGWCPSNTLTGATTQPDGFVAAGGTISGASITGNTSYYSVYTNSSDGTTTFVAGKSGTYYFKAITTTPTTLYATGTIDGSGRYPTNQATKVPFLITYNSSTTKYTIKNTLTDKYVAPENGNGNDLVERDASFEWALETPTINGVLGNAASGEWFFSYYNSSSNLRHIYCDGTRFLSKGDGNYNNYALYLEPATSMYYYNASNCEDLVTMTFHPVAGGDPTWAAGTTKADYTDVAKGTISTFPTDSYDGWTFIGWTAGQSYNANREAASETLNDENASATAPTQTIYKTGGNSYSLTADVDMYPVFTKFPDNEPFDFVNGGDYYIYYIADGDISPSTDVYGANNRIYVSTKDGSNNFHYNVTTHCSEAATFTFTPLGDGKWSIYDNKHNGGTDANPKHYLGPYSANNTQLRLYATANSTDKSIWTISVVNGNQINASCIDDQQLIARSTDALTGTIANYDATSLEGANAASYHKVYVGSCAERVYSSDPSNKPRIYLNGSPIVTASQNGAVRGKDVLSLTGSKLGNGGTVTITSSDPTVTLSTDASYSFARGEGYRPLESITVSANASGVIEPTTIYVYYKPTSNTDAINSVTVTATFTGATDATATVKARSVQENFVIATKVGNTWYALPADMSTATNPAGVAIEVNETSWTAIAPNTCAYKLWPVHTTEYTATTRFTTYGDRVRFAAPNNENKGLWTNNSNDANTLNNDAAITALSSTADNPAAYEWIITATESGTTLSYTLQTDQANNTNYLRYWTAAQGGPQWGTYASGENNVYLIPATFYEEAAAQLLKWKENSVIVMYTGTETTATTKVGTNDAGDAQTLANQKLTHGIYELTTAQALTSNAQKILSISFGSGSTKLNAEIPLIISGTTTASADGHDVVILDGGKLTAAATKYSYYNVYVYGGGKLAIPTGTQLGVSNIILRAGGISTNGTGGSATYQYIYPQMELIGSLSSTQANIKYEYVTDYSHWYHLCLPFNGTLSTIHYPVEYYGDNVTADNTGSWQIKRYAGEIRATGNYNAWKDIETEDATEVTAGKGYIFWGAPKKISVGGAAKERSAWGIQRITMLTTAAAAQTAETANKTISGLGSYSGVDNHSDKVSDQGWNLVGNPYMVNMSGMTNSTLKTGKLVEEIVNGKWTGKWVVEEGSTGTRYVTVPDNHFDTYTAQTVASFTAENPMKTGRTFFVQIEGEATALTFDVSKRAALMPALLHATEADVETGIVMSNETLKDEVNFWIKDGKTAEYEYNADYPKTPNQTNFNIYGVHSHGDLSWVAISPAIAEGDMPIGYQVPAAGTYTLTMSEMYVSEDVESLFVTDHEANPEVTVDLLAEPFKYDFDVLQAETNNTRFTVSIILKDKAPEDPESPGVATDIDDANSENGQPKKFIHNDKMYILRNGIIYDATGKKVREINK